MIECGDMTTSRKGMSGSSNPSSVALLVMVSFVSFMLAPLEGNGTGEGRRNPSEEGIPPPLPKPRPPPQTFIKWGGGAEEVPVV